MSRLLEVARDAEGVLRNVDADMTERLEAAAQLDAALVDAEQKLVALGLFLRDAEVRHAARVPQPKAGEPCLVEDASVDPERAAEALRELGEEPS